MQDQESSTAEVWGQQDQRLHRFVARWTCWVLAAVVIIVDVIFMVQHWAGTIAVPPGAHGYMVVLVILLAGAGWVAGDERLRAAYAAGQATAVAGVRHILAEVGERLAGIEADVAELRARPHLTEERIAETIRAEDGTTTVTQVKNQLVAVEANIETLRADQEQMLAELTALLSGKIVPMQRSKANGSETAQ